MKLENGEVLLSPSDLMRFMGCAHAITLDLARLRGEGPEPVEDSEEAELVQAHGHAHEADYLGRLEAEGRRVGEVGPRGRGARALAQGLSICSDDRSRPVSLAGHWIAPRHQAPSRPGRAHGLVSPVAAPGH